MSGKKQKRGVCEWTHTLADDVTARAYGSDVPFHLWASRKACPLSDVTAHAPLSCRFICGGSDIKQGRPCKAWVKSRKEALLSKLKCLFSAFFSVLRTLPCFASLACGRCWAAGTRTQNDRTKICCVTITPQLNPMLESGAKILFLFRNHKFCQNSFAKTTSSHLPIGPNTPKL